MSAASSKGTVGVVGLGIMGGAIAKNLAASGWCVVGYDIDAARTAEAKAAGVEAVANAAAARFFAIAPPMMPSPITPTVPLALAALMFAFSPYVRSPRAARTLPCRFAARKPVPRTRSSHNIAASPIANFGFKAALE